MIPAEGNVMLHEVDGKTAVQESPAPSLICTLPVGVTAGGAVMVKVMVTGSPTTEGAGWLALMTILLPVVTMWLSTGEALLLKSALP